VLIDGAEHEITNAVMHHNAALTNKLQTSHKKFIIR
jgi:hypothetical protein